VGRGHDAKRTGEACSARQAIDRKTVRVRGAKARRRSWCCRMPSSLRALRQIGREAIIAIGTKDAGIDVRIAAAPEAEAIAPQ
jgi:hypothetical protein